MKSSTQIKEEARRKHATTVRKARRVFEGKIQEALDEYNKIVEPAVQQREAVCALADKTSARLTKQLY